VERVARELGRILPDVPMVSLNGVVDGESFMAATAAIDRVAANDRHLGELQIFLSSS
jgi:hypothetical protein